MFESMDKVVWTEGSKLWGCPWIRMYMVCNILGGVNISSPFSIVDILVTTVSYSTLPTWTDCFSIQNHLTTNSMANAKRDISKTVRETEEERIFWCWQHLLLEKWRVHCLPRWMKHREVTAVRGQSCDQLTTNTKSMLIVTSLELLYYGLCQYQVKC
jgi:hypothetical protein